MVLQLLLHGLLLLLPLLPACCPAVVTAAPAPDLLLHCCTLCCTDWPAVDDLGAPLLAVCSTMDAAMAATRAAAVLMPMLLVLRMLMPLSLGAPSRLALLLPSSSEEVGDLRAPGSASQLTVTEGIDLIESVGFRR